MSTFDQCPFDDRAPLVPLVTESEVAVAELGDHDRFGLLPRYEWPGPE